MLVRVPVSIMFLTPGTTYVVDVNHKAIVGLFTCPETAILFERFVFFFSDSSKIKVFSNSV